MATDAEFDAAAAVAARIVPFAHAGDGGGSIRIPASTCGLFGLKPTRGRVSQAPSRGESWRGFVQEHVVSRSVRDSAALLDLSAGPEPGDPYGKPLPYVLAHGDLIICLDYEDFAGQTWVLHEVDERARGLRKDGAQPSSEKYLAWSHMDFCGHRWLVDETMERRDDNADDEAEFGAMLPEAKRMLREMAKLKSAGAANAADALAALERIERIDFPP